MKKITQAIPNHRLREEREQRGWSQKYVADQIQADRYYLSRWERGTTSPSPYYRQKLCKLFGKTARELGLLPNEDDIADISANQVVAYALQGVDDPIIPPLSTDLVELVGVTELLTQLKQRLCTEYPPAFAALNGLPGIGKTTLAVILAHDSDIRTHFDGGILWAGLGPDANPLRQLSRWGMLLGIPDAEAKTFTSQEAWTQALHAAIGPRRMLLILDDAWTIEDALAFKIGGQNCAYLLTTRIPRVALQFAAGAAIMLHELSEEDSITLFSRLAPQAVASEPRAIRELVQAVGGLPLGLTLIGNYLRLQSYSGQPRRIFAAIKRLSNIETRLNLSEPRALLERSPGLVHEKAISLQSIIAFSDQYLEPQAQTALRALSVFPPKPNSFTEDAALAVCGTTVEILDILSDAGLMESHGIGRYTLHQVIADYARIHLTDATPFKRLVTYFTEYIQLHSSNHDILEAEITNAFAALEAAFAHNLHGELIQLATAFIHFLEARGLYTQAEIHFQRIEHLTRANNDHANLITALLHLGKIAEWQGDYTRAEELLQEGLCLARQHEHDEHISKFLMCLGIIASHRGNYIQAQTYAEEGLIQARLLEDNEQICGILNGLGVVAERYGRYAQAEIYWKEALVLAYKLEDRGRTSSLLANLGWLATTQGKYDRARTYLEEGIVIARHIGHRDRISMFLLNLGLMETNQGHHAEAKRYFEEGLVLTRQIGQSDRICRQLAGLGWVLIQLGSYPQAELYLHEGLDLARQIGHRDLTSLLFASLSVLQGNLGLYAQARKYAQEGLEIARDMGHCERIAMLLTILGTLVSEHEPDNITQAMAYLEEGLTIARQINHPQRMAHLLSALGKIEAAQENYFQAVTYQQEALDIARRIENRNLISIVLNRWGYVQLQQQHIVAAASAFYDALEIATTDGDCEMRATALFNLARAMRAQEYTVEAQRLGQEGLEIFKGLGHYKASEVSQWLTTYS